MTDQNDPKSPASIVPVTKPPEPDGRPQIPALPPEIGGQKGPEPTRYGDWEKNGRCTDF